MRKVEAKVRCKASGGGNAVFENEAHVIIDGTVVGVFDADALPGMAEAVAAKVRLADEIGAAVGRMLAAGAV